MNLFELHWKLTDWSQLAQLEQLNDTVAVQGGKVASNEAVLNNAKIDIQELQARTVDLMGTCQVLCELLIEKAGVSPEDLKKAIESRLATNKFNYLHTCPSCGRRVSKEKPWCVYCGYRPSSDPMA